MNWGMQNRLAKIIHPEDGRCLMLAVDHGYFLGPIERLEVPRRAINPLLPYADSLMLTRGILRTSVDPKCDVPIVLRVSGATSIIGEDLSKETITTSIEEAIRLNASCLALSIFVGGKYEHQTLANLAKLVDEGEKYEIPVLAVTAVGKEMGRDARYLGLACRVAAELGAHVVKTYYCDNFEQVVEGCPVPLIIAGGKKLAEPEALKLAHDAITHGAAGVDMGRNIWQSDWPVAMIKAVQAIVHKNADAKEAYGIFLEEKENDKSSHKERQKVVRTTVNHSVPFD
ncbi:MAG: 3-hydroxy-5-phosphonooxypentane-2,4-dione thiolase [Thermoproteota archaeon]|nr:3-hydroxy-5-phosphonooxypentane-2,4-dione thiolase [Thermoproteota archaeon]